MSTQNRRRRAPGRMEVASAAASPFARLLEDLGRLPSRPVGRHVSEELLLSLADGSASDMALERARPHLQSCSTCADQLLDGMEALRESSAEPVRAAAAAASNAVSEESMRAADQMAAAAATFLVYATLRLYAASFGFRALAGAGARGRHVAVKFLASTIHDWKLEWPVETEGGGVRRSGQRVWARLQPAGRGRILRLDTAAMDKRGELVRCEFIDETPDRDAPIDAPVVWVVLRQDAVQVSRLEARVRLSEEFMLPYRCVPLVCVETRFPEVEKLLEAIAAADTEADHLAWIEWMQQQVAAKVLPEETLSRLPQWRA